MKKFISIRDVVKSMNLTTRTLRYYEEINLISSVQKGRGNRVYSKDELEKILYLNDLKNRGFSLKEIERLLGNECCNQKNIFLKNKIKKNNELINFLIWQNEKMNEEMDIINKLDINNIFITTEKIIERNYDVVDNHINISDDGDVEKIWRFEKYNIKEEHIYVGDFQKLISNKTSNYLFELIHNKNGKYIFTSGEYLIAYSREGLNNQKNIFKQMKLYLDKNQLKYDNKIYVNNCFKIFCKREKKVVVITKNYIKLL